MPTEFDEALAALKERGCNVFVVGEASPRAFRRASRRLFGVPDEPRRRVFGIAARGGGSVEPERWLPGDSDEREGTRLVRYDADHRGTTVEAGETTRFEHRLDEVDVETDAIGAFHRRLNCALEARASEGDTPEAGELRLGIYPLDPVVSDCGWPIVAEFVERIGDRVVEYSGMGHYHLRRSYDTLTAHGIANRCDLIVRLRERREEGEESEVQQKWIVPGQPEIAHGRLESEWMELRTCDDV